MKLNVQPLMEAIEVYIRKADDDLEQTLADEGYVNSSCKRPMAT